MKKIIEKYDIIRFVKLEEKIDKPISKFGGQPVWIEEEQWPVSMGWEDKKMMFIGQILVEKGMLGNKEDLMVYIFVTHPESYEDDFFDPDITEWNGGENAVIIQSFENVQNNINCQKGPTLFDEDNKQYEYIPILKKGYDPEFLTNSEFRKLNDEQQEEYFNLIDVNKIGGIPNFFREDVFLEGEWMLLLQLKCESLPFVLRAGTMSILYIFISKDFKKAGMLIQS